MGKLSGKVAILTGSTYGLGLAMAKKLASEGAKTVLCGRNEENVHSAVDTMKKLGFKDTAGTVCHVANKEQRANLIEKAVEEFGGIDIFISNAGVNPMVGLAENCTESVLDKIFDVNVKAPFFLTQEVLPFLRKSGGGNIIYISTILGFRPYAHFGGYAMSKTALLGMTKVFAAELAKDNIRVNCVAPGVINTNFATSVSRPESPYGWIKNEILLKRFGEPDEVSGIIAFLCSNEASYITGENIVVSGGLYSRL